MRLALCAVLCSGCIDWASLSPPFAPQGFGAATPGGEGKPVVHVTQLGDDGAGSLREALGGNDRRIVFDVGGEITLASDLRINGLAFVTIDGTTAPPPGITLRGGGLLLEGMSHDVIVRNLRVRAPPDDALRVSEMGHDVVFDHVSASGCTNGCLDVTQSSRDVTVQWSVLRKTSAGISTSIVSFGAERVTLHHNLYSGPSGNPEVSGTTAGVTADVRNNVVWGWTGAGIEVNGGARANVVGNWLQRDGGLVVNGAQVHAYGNVPAVSGSGASAFEAPEVTATGACEAAQAVLSSAGARPLDTEDQTFIDGITLTSCP